VTGEPQPHPTSVAVWGAPSPVVAASRFTVTVGVKCSAACPLAGRPVAIGDGTGRELGRGTLGAEPAAGTRALYAAAVTLAAPPEPGVHAWTAAFPAAAEPLPAAATVQSEPAPRHDAAPAPRHEGAACTFSFRTVEPPGSAVTVAVVDRDTQAPLANADVHLGVYRASTDAEGRARVDVPAGEYELYVRSPGYLPYSEPVTVTGDAALSVAAIRVSDADLDDDQVWM
jgi:hypothetical protein